MLLPWGTLRFQAGTSSAVILSAVEFRWNAWNRRIYVIHARPLIDREKKRYRRGRR